MKKLKNIILILLMTPLLSFSQDSTDAPVLENPIMAAEEFTGNEGVTIIEGPFPHIEDTIKQSDLPMFMTNSDGDTIGMILTVRQVQNLDKTSEVAILLEKALIDCDALDSYYVRIIKEINGKVIVLESKISELSNQGSDLKETISDLKAALIVKQGELDIRNTQYDNRGMIIDGLKKDLNKQKVKTIAMAGTGGLILVATIVVSVLFATK